jgi:hypothetical protein
VSARAAPVPPTDEARSELEQRVRGNTRRTQAQGDTQREAYRCQATDFQRAAELLGWYDPRSFIRELTCRNVGFWRWLQVTTQAALWVIGQRIGFRPDYPVHPRVPAVATPANLGLKSGDLIRVRSQAEIERTLDETGKTRGLWFDREMLPYCGQTHGVQRRVERFIDESTGEMIELKTDAIILEGVICTGYQTENRWFCPRAIYPWWREAWLERVEDE